MPGFFSANCSSSETMRADWFGPGASRSVTCDLTDETHAGLLDEFDQAFKHLGLAGKVAVQRRLAHTDARGQCRSGHAFATRLLQHVGQGLQDLQAALARARALASRRPIRLRSVVVDVFGHAAFSLLGLPLSGS
jgi:hypothetical protein